MGPHVRKRKAPAKKTSVLSVPSKESILKLMDEIGGDGHGIQDPSLYVKLGFPSDWIAAMTHTFRSNPAGGPKEVIFGAHEQILKEVTGIYSLPAHWKIAEQIGADTSDAAKALGRGTTAARLAAAIRRKLGGADEGETEAS